MLAAPPGLERIRAYSAVGLWDHRRAARTERMVTSFGNRSGGRQMNRRWILGALTALPAIAGAQSLDGLKSLLSSSDPIVGALKSTLGVTDNQAEGGLGSILTLAQ